MEAHLYADDKGSGRARGTPHADLGTAAAPRRSTAPAPNKHRGLEQLFGCSQEQAGIFGVATHAVQLFILLVPISNLEIDIASRSQSAVGTESPSSRSRSRCPCGSGPSSPSESSCHPSRL